MDYLSLHLAGPAHEKLFTAVFTCPITGEHFAAGNWENEKGVTITDGVCWYKTRKYAMNAAAANYLDCASLRRCIGTEKQPFQRCQDAPHLPAGDIKPPGLPPDVELPTPLSQVDDAAVEVAHKADPPKKALDNWYISFVKKLDAIGIVLEIPENASGILQDSYTCWSNQGEGNDDLLWTAVFTCHLSGERFPSGKMIGKSYEEDVWLLECLDGEGCSSFQRTNLVWYKSKKEAEIAAAGRAIDCLRYRDDRFDGSTQRSNERYCSEEPYRVAEAPEAFQTARGAVGGVEWHSLPQEHRITVSFGVTELQNLLDEESDIEEWKHRYKRNRVDIGDLNV